MSIDLNFWKYQNDGSLDNAAVYQKACCDHETVEGLEPLPIEDILKETAAAFHDWHLLSPLNYERKNGPGSFQITTTPQIVRFDCYSMEQADRKRFSSVMSKFACPLYNPQQGVRFDRLAVFLIGETAEYKEKVEQELSRLLPRLKGITQAVTWEEYVLLSKTCPHIEYNAIIHRAKTLTKVTSFMRFGNAWANRPCQCKTSQLEEDNARRILEELLQKSIQRVVQDFFARTDYE